MSESAYKKEEIVEIPFQNSTIRGMKFKSASGKEFYGFIGIPYAKPPVGDLRFKPPVLNDKFPENMDATVLTDVSIQKQTTRYPEYEVVGSEDCLYLDIFIPELPYKNQSLKSVIFHIHGGGFRMNTGKINFIQCPNMLIEYDIIYVNFTYRLNIFGFLNLGLEDCTGNVGLKDQVAALKWVNKYVHYFGGDANSVCLMGSSSGGLSAHLHMMSPLSKGLFHKVIVESEDIPQIIIPTQKSVEYGFKFGNFLGYRGTDKRELLTFLKSVSAEKLCRASYDSRDVMEDSKLIMTELFGNLVFVPSIEEIEEGAFISDFPRNLWHRVDIVPIIYGLCEHEGALFIRNKYNANEYLNSDYIHKIIKTYISDTLSLKYEKSAKVYEEIVKFYLGKVKDDSDLFHGFLNFCSDIVLQEHYTIYNYMRKPENDVTYHYLFTYEGERNFIKNFLRSKFPVPLKGTCHSDESEYIKNYNLLKLPPNKDDELVSRNLCYMWTNFAKTGNPNGKNLKVEWKPSTMQNPCYLRIDKDLILLPGIMNDERYKFWKYLLEKYSLYN